MLRSDPVRLLIPDPGVGLMTSNQRLHWGAKARATRAWRDATHWHARARGVPTGWPAAYVLARVHPKARRRRDVHNYAPTIKAVVDGLVDHGLIPDDDDTHLIGPDLRIGAPMPMRAQVTLTLIPLTLEDVADYGNSTDRPDLSRQADPPL